MNINVDVSDVNLASVVHEGDDYRSRQTLGDVVADRMVENLLRQSDYQPLRQRVLDIQNEEIRAQLAPIIAEAIAAPVQKTTHYGDPVGEPKPLREIVIEEAKAWMSAAADPRSYDRTKPTKAQKLVADAVDASMRKELAAAIAAEKEKVVAAVRAKAGELIAEAVKQGIGR